MNTTQPPLYLELEARGFSRFDLGSEVYDKFRKTTGTVTVEVMPRIIGSYPTIVVKVNSEHGQDLTTLDNMVDVLRLVDHVCPQCGWEMINRGGNDPDWAQDYCEICGYEGEVS